MTPHPLAAPSLAAALLCGCASITAGQRAQTLGRGNLELGLETSYRASLTRDTVQAFPTMSLAGRLGVTDRVDAGVRVGAAGLGASAKLRLDRGAGRTAWSLAPSIDWVHAYDDGIGFDTLETSLPLLASYRVSDTLELEGSARVHSSLLHVLWSDRSYLHTLGVGGGVGLGIRGSRAWLLPEVGALWPFLVTGEPADEMGGTTTQLGKVIAQVSLTVMWGNR